MDALVGAVTKTEMHGLLDLIHSSLSCRTHETFLSLITQFQNLIPFDHLFCTYGDLAGVMAGKKGATCDTVMSPGYPEEWRKRYMEKRYYAIDCVSKSYFETFEVQNWQEARDRLDNGKKSIVQQEAETFGITEGYSYGARDRNMKTLAAVSIAAGKKVYSRRTEYMLMYAVPHLSECLFRISGRKERLRFALTPREREVLKWLKEGKTRWEIAIILAISHRTVCFHVNNVVQKLNAVNSRQAVAVAMENEIL